MSTQPLRPNSRRAVPGRPTSEQREALRRWLEQSERWVLRPVWERWLSTLDRSLETPVADLTRNQHVAACAWLVQQRHALHDVIEGGPAPEGWLESRPLYRALSERLEQRPTEPRTP